MNPLQKRLLNIFKIAFFIHFILIFFYCFPDKYVPGILDNISKKYAYPLFQARWNLFAPDPPRMHKELRFKYYAKGNWSDWQDPVTDIETAFNKNRLGAPTKLYHVIQNGSHYLWDDYYTYNGDSVITSFGYQTMNYFIPKMYPEIEMDSVQLKLILEGPVDFIGVGEETYKELHFPPKIVIHE